MNQSVSPVSQSLSQIHSVAMSTEVTGRSLVCRLMLCSVSTGSAEGVHKQCRGSLPPGT